MWKKKDTVLCWKQDFWQDGLHFRLKTELRLKPLRFTSPLSTTARPTCQTLRSNKKTTRIPVLLTAVCLPPIQHSWLRNDHHHKKGRTCKHVVLFSLFPCIHSPTNDLNLPLKLADTMQQKGSNSNRILSLTMQCWMSLHHQVNLKEVTIIIDPGISCITQKILFGSHICTFRMLKVR